MKNLAPIVVFAYKRPNHVKNLLDSLALCSESKDSDLVFFSDGPKNAQDSKEIEAIQKVREICQSEDRFRSVNLYSQEKNQGLAKSIIQGVSTVLEKYGRVIVLEDDLVVSPFFLNFMNSALDKFDSDDRVGQIGACNFFACGKNFPEAFFIPIPDCLGWATWKRNWDEFIHDPEVILSKLQENEELSFRFNGYGSYDFSGLLKSNVERKVDSWAILWHATCMIKGWLTLYPNPAMTNHIESAEATHANINISPPLAQGSINLDLVEVKELKEVIYAMKLGYSGKGDFFGKRIKTPLWARLKNFLRA